MRTATWIGSASASTEQDCSSDGPSAASTALPVIPTSGAAVSVCASPTSDPRSTLGVGNASTTDGRAPSSAASACSTAAVTEPGPVANPDPARGDRTAVAIPGLSATERPGFMPHFELLGQYGPTLVVAPATADLQVARREPLPLEAGPLREPQGALVRGLDVRLDAVQTQVAEREAQRQLHPLAHVTLAGVGATRPVAEVGVLERAAHDPGQLEEAHDRVVFLAPCEQRVEVVGAIALQQPPVAGGIGRRKRPRPVQLQTCFYEVEELAAVARLRLGQTDARGSHQSASNCSSPTTGERSSDPTLRTASSTPGMNDSREIESCLMVSVSPRPPKMTSWWATSPGSRTEWIDWCTLPPASRISSAVRLAVPDGASFFWSWCSSMISTSGMWAAIWREACIIITAPIAKFGATNRFALPTPSRLEKSAPVVPITQCTPASRQSVAL